MDRHITIRGRRWRLRYQRLPIGMDGECEAPDVEGKRILIHKGLKDLDELETLLHEMIHAAYWDLNEEAVHDGAHDIALALWRIGYRKHP
jgi:hypothetical protein